MEITISLTFEYISLHYQLLNFLPRKYELYALKMIKRYTVLFPLKISFHVKSHPLGFNLESPFLACLIFKKKLRFESFHCLSIDVTSLQIEELYSKWNIILKTSRESRQFVFQVNAVYGGSASQGDISGAIIYWLGCSTQPHYM